MLELVVDNGPSPGVSAERRGLLALIHLGKKQVGLCDDDYRALLVRVVNQSSAKDCSIRELEAIVAELKRLGFKPFKGKSRRKRADNAIARKARALWIGLHALGAVRDSSEAALEAFAKRQIGVSRLQWADQSHSAPLIEALKDMAERQGWEQKVPRHSTVGARALLLNRRLVTLLSKRLIELGKFVPAFDPDALDLTELHDATRLLGERLREAKAD